RKREQLNSEVLEVRVTSESSFSARASLDFNSLCLTRTLRSRRAYSWAVISQARPRPRPAEGTTLSSSPSADPPRVTFTGFTPSGVKNGTRWPTHGILHTRSTLPIAARYVDVAMWLRSSQSTYSTRGRFP